VRADLGSTVGAFKAIVAESCDVPAPQQRLIYKGRILKDDQTLASYGACFPLSSPESALPLVVRGFPLSSPESALPLGVRGFPCYAVDCGRFR